MLEAIREIGAEIIKGTDVDLIDNLILDFPPEVKKVKQHIVILNYDVFDKTIKFEPQEISDQIRQDYLWVGSADASRSPQIYFTVKANNVGHLLSQAIPNVLQRCEKGGELYSLLHLAREELFIDLKFSGKNKYILNGEKVGLLEKGHIKRCLREGKNENKKDNAIFKEILKSLEAGLLKRLKSEIRFTKKEIGLITLKINGRIMAQKDEYRSIIVKEKIDSIFHENKKICSCCNKSRPFTDKPKFAKAKSALGSYITDKYGFSSELSGVYANRFSICKDCYKKILVGEIFVRNKLSSRLGGLNVYIVPKFLFLADIGKKRISAWADYVIYTFNTVKTYKNLEYLENRLEEFREMESLHNTLTLNFFFWQQGTGSETKIQKLIVNVAPTRLLEITRVSNQIGDIGGEFFGESNLWRIDLQCIYYLIPLRERKSKGETWLEYRKLLHLYDSILTGKPVSLSFLVNQFVLLARIFRFEQFETYQLRKPEQPNRVDRALVNSILQANLLLCFLRKLKLIFGGGPMNHNSLSIDDETKIFIQEMQYDEPRVAMFLLGTLIGSIGNAQYNSESKKKSILNKITFQGMNKNKVIRVSNEIFEKLIEYKQLDFCEMRFSEFKRLIDNKIEDWPLSDQDNVFYILSGYAFSTKQAILQGKKRKSESKGKEREGHTNGK